MEPATSRLTVYFEEPFWVGVYERTADRLYEVCKVTFGAEPRDAEVYEAFLQNWRRLRFGPTIGAETPPDRRVNPKRMQRIVRKQVQPSGIGTKAQQALKLQQEQGKQTRKAASRAERDAEEARKFDLRQQKRREKHRGH